MVKIKQNGSLSLDEKVICALAKKRENLTPREIREDTVSGVFGLLSSKSKVTKGQIRNELDRMYGPVE